MTDITRALPVNPNPLFPSSECFKLTITESSNKSLSRISYSSTLIIKDIFFYSGNPLEFVHKLNLLPKFASLAELFVFFNKVFIVFRLVYV